MENKYFTPSIEDIRVGYECEKAIIDFSSTGGKPLDWKKYIIGQDMDVEEKGLREMSQYVLWNTGGLRVPYLTKEQIEAEGWIKQDNKFNEEQRVAWKPDYEFKTDFGSLRLYIPKLDKPYEDICIERYTKSNPNNVWSMSGKWIVYRGGCRCINDFRYISKLLGI